MKYEVVTPIYHTQGEMAIEDYVFVEANNEDDAAALAIPMLKDQYPNGYYATVQPEDEREGLRFLPTQAGSDSAGPVIQENNNVTPPAPVPTKRG